MSISGFTSSNVVTISGVTSSNDFSKTRKIIKTKLRPDEKKWFKFLEKNGRHAEDILEKLIEEYEFPKKTKIVIRKHPIQYDSGGVLFEHVFLIPWRIEINTEDDVDRFVEGQIYDFRNSLKFKLMIKLGYNGIDENGKWVK